MAIRVHQRRDLCFQLAVTQKSTAELVVTCLFTINRNQRLIKLAGICDVLIDFFNCIFGNLQLTVVLRNQQAQRKDPHPHHIQIQRRQMLQTRDRDFIYRFGDFVHRVHAV